MPINYDIKILVVDDKKEYRLVYKKLLENEGYYVITAKSAEEGLKFLEEEVFNLVLTDLVLPEMNGIEFLKIIKRIYANSIEVIIITGYGTIESAVEAMKYGAFSYFIKDNNPEELILEINKAKKIISLSKENKFLREQLNDKNYLLKSNNKTMQKVIQLANRISNSNANVLITGESGVGKEVLAKYIHNNSNRHNKPFITINCSEYSRTLLESELFGHEKGAFTGAITKSIGQVERSHKGTLFLDEVTEISLPIQVKLLRVLETKKIKPIGSEVQRYIDFRLISATNKNVQKEIENKKFRKDLLYRLNTIELKIPPLRERKDDLNSLIFFFKNIFERETKKKIREIEKDVLTLLEKYNYPGNIRELKNIIERLIVLSPDGIIRKNYLPEEVITNKNNGEFNYFKFSEVKPLKEVKNDFESNYIKIALKKNNNNVSKTARNLNISRRHLINKINDYNLRK
jgi:two-component system, NtrC family, response regulator HydG